MAEERPTLNCENAEERFSEFFDGELAPDERTPVESHLRSCGRCQEEYRHFRTSLNSLHSTSQLETSEIFATGVVETVRRETTRRRRRPWKWMPIAAAACGLAFAGGMLLRRPPKETVREVVREKEVPGPSVEKTLTPADKERILAEYGLVKSGHTWLPRAMKENFEQGQVCLGGEMMSPDAAFAKLSIGRTIPPHVVKVDLDGELAKLGYVKVGKDFVRQDWLEAWSRGKIQTGADEWKTSEEFQAEFMEAHNLVEFKGVLMSREHRDELLAQRILRRPERATADNEVTSALVGLEIGPPATYKNLTLIPLLTSREAHEAEFVTLHASLEGGKIELVDAATPFEIKVVNSGPRAVLLAEGEILLGGRYARMVARDTLVPSKKHVQVPVHCVEPGALRKDEKFTAESGHYFGAYGLRKLGLSGVGQGALWSQLTRQIELTGGKAKSQPEVYRQISTDLYEYRTYFADLPERYPDAVGVVICVGESVEAVELFYNRVTFASYFERVLSAAALEAALRGRDRGVLPKPSGVPHSLAGIRQVLESPFFASYETRDDELVVRKDGRPIGRASVDAERILHLLLFAEMPGGEPDWRASYKVPNDKLKKVIEEMDRDIREGDPLSRSKAVYVMSLLNVKEATARLVGHLGEPESLVRRSVLLALGQREDARAVPALLDVLEKSRKERVIYESAAAALARIGDEKAVEPFLRCLESEAEHPNAILMSLPTLLLQVKNRDLLEKSVARLINLQEEAEGIVKGVGAATPRWTPGEASTLLVALRGAMEGLTGGTFETAAKAREWWNKRENREAFLRERTGR